MRLTHVELERERQYADIRRLADALKIPIVETFLEIEVFDSKGRRTRRHAQRSHSVVRNFYNWLTSQMMAINGSDDTWGDGYINRKTYPAGTVEYSDKAITLEEGSHESASIRGYCGGAATSNVGPVVGSGTTAESFEDYALDTVIAHGNGAGQLAYQASNVPTKTWTAGTRVYQVKHLRYFNNNSGGVVTVREIGLVCGRLYLGTWQPTMVSRDVLASAIDVADAGQLKVTYTFEITYPS